MILSYKKKYLYKIYQNSILHDKNKQVKILKKYQMCVLETIWKIIKWNLNIENKYIIKGVIR